MDETIIYLIIGLVTLLIGYLAGNYIRGLKTKSEHSALQEKERQLQFNLDHLGSQLSHANDEKNELRQHKEQLGNQIIRKEADLENLQQKYDDQREEVEKLQEKFIKDFKILANNILEDTSAKFTEQNQRNINNILNPLQEKIEKFEKRVGDTSMKNFGLHAELKQQIKGLSDLNQQMSKDADNLTKALKGDSKLQGNWGELVLTRILEATGLNLGREYTIQESIIDINGKRLQPDVLIHLPDGKKMIIDSKVSLTSFERFVSAEDEGEKKVYLKKHIESVRRHVSQLSEKKYHFLIDESPDTIFMFIPIEPAFTVATSNDSSLYQDAFDKQVIIVTPSLLTATIKLVDNLWQNDRQKQNALEIAREAGALYDSFTNLTDELLKVGKQIDTAKGSYDTAMKKLLGRRNLIRRVENLRVLGAKASKGINPKLLKRADEHELEQSELETKNKDK